MGNTLYNVCDNSSCICDICDYEIDIHDSDSEEGIIKPSIHINPILNNQDYYTGKVYDFK